MKKIFDTYEIQKILKSFDGQKLIEIKIKTNELFTATMQKPTLSAEENDFKLVNADGFYTSYILYNDIKYLKIEEEGPVASITIGLENTKIIFYYKNL